MALLGFPLHLCRKLESKSCQRVAPRRGTLILIAQLTKPFEVPRAGVRLQKISMFQEDY